VQLTRLNDKPAVVGHRGASGHAPENTMASFKLAHEMGANIVECDVHLSADGVPVVIHDETLDRTTDGTGLVKAQTVAQLADLGVPTLDELLAWAATRIAVSIEIKNGPLYYDGLVEKTVELVRKHVMADKVFAISFDHFALRRVKELEPAIACGALFAARPVDGPAIARACRADALLPHWAFATRDVVDQAHAAGIAVSVWTCNDDHAIDAALSAGVDAIATDYPDRVIARLAAPA
jgi:glycerophosphoryl diester phosphodiesterase